MAQLSIRKLSAGKLVVANENFGFRKFFVFPNPVTPDFNSTKIDLSKLNLPAGTYSITVTATSIGLTESQKSNSVLYIVN